MFTGAEIGEEFEAAKCNRRLARAGNSINHGDTANSPDRVLLVTCCAREELRAKRRLGFIGEDHPRPIRRPDVFKRGLLCRRFGFSSRRLAECLNLQKPLARPVEPIDVRERNENRG